MGWGHGIDGNGREIGYSVEAVCDAEGCEEKIDRGLYYRCGPLDGDESMPGCGGYFCGKHLWVVVYGPDNEMVSAGQGGGFCHTCAARIEAEEFAVMPE